MLAVRNLSDSIKTTVPSSGKDVECKELIKIPFPSIKKSTKRKRVFLRNRSDDSRKVIALFCLFNKEIVEHRWQRWNATLWFPIVILHSTRVFSRRTEGWSSVWRINLLGAFTKGNVTNVVQKIDSHLRPARRCVPGVDAVSVFAAASVFFAILSFFTPSPSLSLVSQSRPLIMF